MYRFGYDIFFWRHTTLHTIFSLTYCTNGLYYCITFNEIQIISQSVKSLYIWHTILWTLLETPFHNLLIIVFHDTFLWIYYAFPFSGLNECFNMTFFNMCWMAFKNCSCNFQLEYLITDCRHMTFSKRFETVFFRKTMKWIFYDVPTVQFYDTSMTLKTY